MFGATQRTKNKSRISKRRHKKFDENSKSIIMGLSSNILWHQTSYANLRKILAKRRILCSYSLEDMRFILGKKVAFAMVSMCDLPFSELSTYMGKYGNYSLGLSRSWGIAHKFNPIWYCEPQSMVAEELRKTLKRMKLTGADDSSILLFSNALSYIKMVEGELPKRNYSRYRFYDEREVRFVPSFLYMINGDEAPLMFEEDYQKYKTNNNGTSLLNYGVDFEWEDLKYIIVKEEKQIQPLRDFLINHGCPNDTVQIFHSKQIVEDFIGDNHNEMEESEMTKSEVKELLENIIEGIKKAQTT